MIHSFNCVSPLSFLDRTPGLLAIGHVWITGRSRNTTTASQCDRNVPAMARRAVIAR